MSRLHYQPEIDGLRALAIVPVVVFHAVNWWMPGGFLGVDVFFVISGYLITRLIIGEIASGQFSLVGFWERRARRLLPAALVMSMVVWIIGALVLLPSEFRRLGQEIFSHSLFVANFYFWVKSGGYFDPVAETRPLLHTWSLAVEEQFYLLAAPALLLIFARLGIGGVRFAAYLIVFLSLCAALALRVVDPKAAFFLLPSRAWELGLGSVLAVNSPRISGPTSGLIGAAGLAMLVFAYLSTPSAFSPSVSTIVAAVGTALTIVGATSPNVVQKTLRVRPIVWIGLLSYSLYLWHWPALVFLRTLSIAPPSFYEVCGVLLLAALAAVASYFLVESPIRRGRLLPRRRQILWVAAIAGLGMGSIGLATHLFGGLAFRWSAPAIQLAAGEEDRYERRGECRGMSPERIRSEGLCRLGNGMNSAHGPVLIWGDSHADAMMALFDKWADENQIGGWQATRVGCGPYVDAKAKDCADFSSSVLEFAQRNGVSDVILVARWEAGSRHRNQARQQLARTVRSLSDMGMRVWLMRQVPRPGFDVPKHLARAVERGRDLPRLTREEYENTTRSAEDSVIDGVPPLLAGILDPSSEMCDATLCYLEKSGRSLYFDDNHISSFGARTLSGIMAPVSAVIRSMK